MDWYMPQNNRAIYRKANHEKTNLTGRNGGIGGV